MDSDTATVIGIVSYLILTLIFSILGVVWFFRLRSFKKKYAGIADADAYVAERKAEADKFFDAAKERIEEIIQKLKDSYDSLKNEEVELIKKINLTKQEYKEKFSKLKELETALRPVQELVDLAEDGFSLPKFELEDHPAYVVAVKKNREDQKSNFIGNARRLFAQRNGRLAAACQKGAR